MRQSGHFPFDIEILTPVYLLLLHRKVWSWYRACYEITWSLLYGRSAYHRFIHQFAIFKHHNFCCLVILDQLQSFALEGILFFPFIPYSSSSFRSSRCHVPLIWNIIWSKFTICAYVFFLCKGSLRIHRTVGMKDLCLLSAATFLINPFCVKYFTRFCGWIHCNFLSFSVVTVWRNRRFTGVWLSWSGFSLTLLLFMSNRCLVLLWGPLVVAMMDRPSRTVHC